MMPWWGSLGFWAGTVAPSSNGTSVDWPGIAAASVRQPARTSSSRRGRRAPARVERVRRRVSRLRPGASLEGWRESEADGGDLVGCVRDGVLNARLEAVEVAELSLDFGDPAALAADFGVAAVSACLP